MYQIPPAYRNVTPQFRQVPAEAKSFACQPAGQGNDLKLDGQQLLRLSLRLPMFRPSAFLRCRNPLASFRTKYTLLPRTALTLGGSGSARSRHSRRRSSAELLLDLADQSVDFAFFELQAD
jgi:hypothetical protein